MKKDGSASTKYKPQACVSDLVSHYRAVSWDTKTGSTSEKVTFEAFQFSRKDVDSVMWWSLKDMHSAAGLTIGGAQRWKWWNNRWKPWNRSIRLIGPEAGLY